MKTSLLSFFLRILFLTGLLCISSKGNAYDFIANNIAYTIISESEVEVTYKSSEYEGEIIIPETINNEGIIYAVTGIGENAFRGCLELTSIIIPEGVINIGDRAFQDCNGITSITLPESVKKIGYIAFAYCEKLSSVTFFGYIMDMDRAVFEVCPNLESVAFLSGAAYIGEYAFHNCTKLISVTISGNLTSIGENAFTGCFELSSITIPEGLTEIGPYAFGGCHSLSSIILPESVENIGKSAFAGCTGLTFIQLHSSVPPAIASPSYINDCPLYVPEGSLDIYKKSEVWKDFEYISEYLPGSSPFVVDGISYIAYNDQEVKVTRKYPLAEGKLEIPESVSFEGTTYEVSRIDYHAFKGCEGLTSMTLPETVASIGEGAFQECCNLLSVNIPYGVERIESYTFNGCEKLPSITIPGSVEFIDAESFTGLGNGIPEIIVRSFYPPEMRFSAFDMGLSRRTVYVPKGATEFYSVTEPWLLAEIKEYDLTSLPEIQYNGDVSGIELSTIVPGTLTIHSPKAQKVIFYNPAGIAAFSLVLQEGENIFTSILPGVYFLGGKKVIIP